MAEATETTLPAPAPLAEPWKPKFNPWLIAVVVAMAAFMEVLDTSIANVALPHMAGEPGRQQRRKYLGADFLPRLQRHRSAHQRMACQSFRTKALFSCLHFTLHHQFTVLRRGPEPCDSDRFPRGPGNGRRRTPAHGPSHSGRHISRPSNAAWPSRFTGSPPSWRPPSAPRSAAGSPTTTPGAGFSTSIFPSEF